MSCIVLQNTATYCLSVPLFVHFSFTSMEFVTDFSASIGASVFKFCVHLQVGEVYCVNENKDENPHILPSFFIFSFCRPYKIRMDIFFCQRFLSNYLIYDSEF